VSTILPSGGAYPILVISSSDGGRRSGLQSGFPSATPAGRQQQSGRLAPRFAALNSAISNERLTVSDDLRGHDPELVVVFEVNASLADFAKAASRMGGLEFLAEFVEDPEPPENGISTRRPGQFVDRTLYVLAQNQLALQQLQRLWQLWTTEDRPVFERGLAPWKQIFALLKDVRPWSPADRIAGTQLEEVWRRGLRESAGFFVAEVELWFRKTASARQSAEAQVRADLALAGCEVLDSTEIDPIAYHALLVRVDAATADATLRGTSVLVSNARVSLVRPQMLATERLAVGPLERSTYEAASDPADAPPLIGVLDAVPITGHQLLRNRVVLDDPDSVQDRIPVSERVHGTAVASLVVWGDREIDGLDPLARRVYTRPLFTDGSLRRGVFEESMPSDRLAVAVMNEILERMYVGVDGDAPVAPTVRVVLIAAGHTALPFGSKMSPWGRLLDVYSSRYNVLFIVSAGNYPGPIELDPSVDAAVLDDEVALQETVRRHLFATAHERRLLSPADSVNALTVGALHADSTGAPTPLGALDVLGTSVLPSPASALGGGYLRSMKPDVFADGGRVFYRHRFDRQDRVILDVIESSDAAPGLRAAFPGRPGEVSAEGHLRGTSAAAALVGHEAGHLAELLAGGSDGALVPERHLGVAVKALLANSVAWTGAEDFVEEALLPADRGELRRSASRLIGYGGIRSAEIASCHARKITLVSTGVLLPEASRLVEVPLPVSLNGRRDVRRVITSLAWFSPVNPRQKSYRQARVWFDIENAGVAGVSSVEGERRATRRGALQHEVFEGDRAVAIANDANLEVKISCMPSAGGMSAPVAFALAVTFEVEGSSPVRVYDEIRSVLRTRARVQAETTRVRA